ncbi:uncharacterized protein [Solanum lycopersicum]|uniref:uncharacterized protein n=1 Tax=Solanum lycopersicum TaxID=4081 RepID=UPI0037480828
MATLDNTTISIVDFLMVEDGRYQHFPWGHLSFSKLIGSLRQDFDVSKKLYQLYGMPYALNVWIYECASNLNSEIAVKERNVIPRMCNWRVMFDKVKFEMLMSTIFQENACSNIVPTAEEIEAFDLAQVEHAHSSSLPLVQPNEKDDFDNFSTKPPEQLLMTYSRVSDTSPPPPPKRRKKVIIQKNKVSEQNQPDQSNVSLTPDDDVHVSMSNLPANSNADDVHDSVPDVDKKFEELIILIKENHSQLKQSIGKENIIFQANTITFQSDKQTSQQIPIDLSDMGGVAEDGVGFSGKNGEHQIVEDAGDVAEDGVGVAVNEGEQLVSDTPKDGGAHQSNQDLNEHIMEQDVDDNVQHNIPHVLPEKTTMDVSEPSTSTTISPSTQAAIDALIKDLSKDPTNARLLYSYNPQNITSSQYLLTDNKLPTDIPTMEIGVRTDSVTPAHRNRMPSRRIQSPYCTFFGSSEKGKEKLKDMTRLHFPFEGCGITDQVSPKLTEDNMNWLSRGLLKNHNNKYYMDDDDDSLTTLEHINRASVVSVHERSIINIIKGFGIPAALPWHLVDEGDKKNERTKFADCHAYKDNITGSLLEPQVPFMIEFSQDIPKEDCDSLDCGLYVTAFAEYMSDQINISYVDFSPDYLRQRYGALLWSYGSEKAKCGYVSDNDDPPKSRGIVTPPPEEDLVHIV